MGGALGVTSTLGSGSTFLFSAPLSRDAVEPPVSSRSQQSPGKTVLIVDDNPSSRVILQEALSAWGIEATGCGSSEVPGRPFPCNPMRL